MAKSQPKRKNGQRGPSPPGNRTGKPVQPKKHWTQVQAERAREIYRMIRRSHSNQDIYAKGKAEWGLAQRSVDRLIALAKDMLKAEAGQIQASMLSRQLAAHQLAQHEALEAGDIKTFLIALEMERDVVASLSGSTGNSAGLSPYAAMKAAMGSAPGTEIAHDGKATPSNPTGTPGAGNTAPGAPGGPPDRDAGNVKGPGFLGAAGDDGETPRPPADH